MMAVAKLGALFYEFLCVVGPAVVDLIGRRTELLESGHVNLSEFATTWKAIEPTGIAIHDAQSKVPLPHSLVAFVEFQMVSNKAIAETSRQRNLHG